jgi:chromate reductase
MLHSGPGGPFSCAENAVLIVIVTGKVIIRVKTSEDYRSQKNTDQFTLRSTMSQKIRIVGLTGSLRATSHNKAALHLAQELLPTDVEMEILSLADLPDYQGDRSENETVATFKAALRRADAILIATPEFRSLLSNALKNALNWAGSEVLYEKPVAIMGFGRQADPSQPLLRSLLASFGANILDEPRLYTASHHLSHEATHQQMAALLNTLTNAVRGPEAVLV